MIDRIGQMAGRIEQIQRKLEGFDGREADAAPVGFAAWLQQEMLLPTGGVHAQASPTSARAGQFDTLIASIAASHGMDPDLVHAVVRAESNHNPNCVSSAGAGGLMQLMPATARHLGVSDRFDPAQNLDGGVRYLKAQMERFGDLRLALAAYNAGPGAVAQYGGIPPYRETQAYVPRVMRYYQERKTGGVTVPPAAARHSSSAVRHSSVSSTALDASAVISRPPQAHRQSPVAAATDPPTIQVDGADDVGHGQATVSGQQTQRHEVAHVRPQTVSATPALEAASSRPEPQVQASDVVAARAQPPHTGHMGTQSVMGSTLRARAFVPAAVQSAAQPVFSASADVHTVPVMPQLVHAGAVAPTGHVPDLTTQSEAVGTHTIPYARTSEVVAVEPRPGASESAGAAAGDGLTGLPDTYVRPADATVPATSVTALTATALAEPQSHMQLPPANQVSVADVNRLQSVVPDTFALPSQEGRLATELGQLLSLASEVPVSAASASPGGATTSTLRAAMPSPAAMPGTAAMSGTAVVSRPISARTHADPALVVAQTTGRGAQTDATLAIGQVPREVAVSETGGHVEVSEMPVAALRSSSTHDRVWPLRMEQATDAAVGFTPPSAVSRIADIEGHRAEASDLRSVASTGAPDGDTTQPPSSVSQQLFEAVRQPLRTLVEAATVARPTVQVADRIEPQQITIQLSPPELGQVQVRLGLNDAGATLHVRAENMTAAMHLDAGFRDLGERLEQFGIRLAGLQVSYDGSAGWAMGQDAHSRGQQWAQPSMYATTPPQLFQAAADEAQASATASGHVSRRQLPLAYQRQVLDAVV